MDVITRHDSHLIVYSSADAAIIDPVYGNGRFSCLMPNVNRGGTHAIKVVPTRVMIPNVFPNITQLERFHVSGTILDIQSGFYTISRVLEMLNSAFLGFVFSLDDTNRVRVVQADPNTTPGVIHFSSTIATMLGFTKNSRVNDGFPFWAEREMDLPTVALDMPYFGTTPIVHVLAKKVANNNMLSSNGTEYSVLATVTMTPAEFGQYAVYNAPDIFLDDIDFRSPRSIGDVEFEIVDHAFNPLVIDPKFPVIVQLKVYHTDTKK